MYCSNCGKEIDSKLIICPNCGSKIYKISQITNNDKPKRSQLIAIISWLFFGFIGLHNFYLGEYGWGIIKIFFIIINLRSFSSLIVFLFWIFLLNIGDFISIIAKINKNLLSDAEQTSYSPPQALVILSRIFYLIGAGFLLYKALF